MATPRLITTFFPENCSLYLDQKEQIHGWIAGQCWIGIEIPSREQMWKTEQPLQPLSGQSKGQRVLLVELDEPVWKFQGVKF